MRSSDPKLLVSFSLCWACLFIFEILNEILRLKTLVSSFLSLLVLVFEISNEIFRPESLVSFFSLHLQSEAKV
jgi:hypothetical protein